MLVGKEEFDINQETCKDVLRGFWDPIIGCIINSKSPPSEREEGILISPLKSRILPVIIPEQQFVDISTDAGMWSDFYTFVIK